MFEYAREEVSAWMKRELEEYYPIIYIDATFINTRRIDSVSKEAYYSILGVKQDTSREVLSVINNPTESSFFWSDIFNDLKNRGVKEIGLVVTDGLRGIENVINKHYKEAEIQLCTVHLQRECQKYVKPRHKAEMAMDLKEVFSCDDKKDTKAAGMERWKEFCRKWKEYYPVFGNKMNNEWNVYYFTYLDYHYKIRSMIYTTN